MKLFASLTVLLLATSYVFAASSPTSCADKYENLDNTSVQTIAGNSGCFISVNPRNTVNLTYRDFLFDDDGLFMIFNSFGPGPESETTGAREIYFFPRNVKPLSYEYSPADKLLAVTTPSGKVFTFNTEKAILVSISGTNFTQDYNVVKGNNGGIQITQNDGFYLDLGFTLGQSPSQNPNRKITFKDTANRTCQVKNSGVFKYTADSDVVFKYNDAQLKTYLKTSCPQLKL